VIKLNEKQQYAYDRIKSGANVFITGPGGVGKSVLIRKISEEMENGLVLLAPTGIAAQNILGATIHRTFRFGFGFLTKGQRRRVNERTQDVFALTGTDDITRIVIDEISMVRADVLAAIDMQLRVIRKTLKPFGGIQIIAVGDFYQLSPIVKNNSEEANALYSEFKSMYAFDTQAWKEADFEMIQLDQVMRQSDTTFVNALNSIRTKNVGFKKSLDFLNDEALKEKDFGDHDPIYLCATNKSADVINNYFFDEINSRKFTYHGIASPGFKDFPVPVDISLKVGCKVMICANDRGGSYFNGQTGMVTSLSINHIEIELDHVKKFIRIEKQTWEEYDYVKVDGKLTKKVVGTFIQYPIKLGYAITIHKSQGLSLDSAILHTEGRCFAHGQAYVALSRLRSLDGLIMHESMKPHEIIVDKIVTSFYEEAIFRQENGLD